jgi:Amidohydrolase
MRHLLLVPIIASLIAATAAAQPGTPRPPVIDMHVHGDATSPLASAAQMNALNIRYLFLSSSAADLRLWADAGNPSRYLPALQFPCPGGVNPITGRACFNTTTEFPDVAWVRDELRAGRIRAFGELVPEYLGMAPNDPRLDAYWQLAEEFDLPVAIHMGIGPPGAAYDKESSPSKSPNFRIAAGDPRLLEDVLLKHKRLRLYVMHAGFPYLESMLALLYLHPNVYVDVGALQATFVVPREAYYRYLRGLMENGFAKRIMFGSDLVFANQAPLGINAILAADFLNSEQKADILCRNAQRFLGLSASVCSD